MVPAPASARRPVVGIVGPSGYAPPELDLALAHSRLGTLGFEVRDFTPPQGAWQRFAADDAARCAGLHAAARDPEIDVVLALRGGYGASRLLDMLDFPLLASSGKCFVGHSDFTAIQMGLLAQGGASFAGPMLCSDFAPETVSDYTLSQFVACLRGPQHVVNFLEGGGGAAVGLNSGRSSRLDSKLDLGLKSDPAPSPEPAHAAGTDIDVTGILWGGNLAMLAHLVGTPWMPVIAGGILFIEDTNEHPFRIERMLLQLLHAGILGRQGALVLGDFSGGATGAYDNGYDFAATLTFLRSRLPLPILTGLPFGHIAVKTTLAVGSQARLECDAGRVRLTMTAYPTLK